MITKKLLTQYHRLFLHSEAQKYALAKIEGNEVKYPHQRIYKQVEGKEETEYKYLTDKDLISSIKGDCSLGVMLIQDKTGLTKSGCIDIDTPRDAKDLTEGLTLAQRLQEIALKSNLKAYIEFSGNRGYHLWIFSEKLITAPLMQNCLKHIASLANFEVKEIFPNSHPIESKCIKLPATTHLKSNLRSGFIAPNFNPNQPHIELDSQGELMAEFERNSLDDILAIAKLTTQHETINSPNGKKVNQGINSDNGKPINQNETINSDNGKPINQTETINSDNGNPINQTETINSHNGKPINQGINSHNGKPLNQNETINSENKPQNPLEVKEKLNSFSNQHPSCITHLINNGAPLEIDYNQVNLTLVRYCLTREISSQDSLKMAESMAKNTSDSHPTRKDYQGKVSNFKSCYTSATRNISDYQFNCSYVLANNKGNLKDRGCIGSKCPLFVPKDNETGNYSHNSDTAISNYPQFEVVNLNGADNYSSNSDAENKSNHANTKHIPLNRLIFESMIELTNEDKEICPSNLLLKIEPQYNTLLTNYNCQINKNSSAESVELLESEVLASLIQHPNTISDYLEIFPQGFITSTDKTLSKYLDYLLSLDLPSDDTLESHIDLIREQGIKAIAISNYQNYIKEIKEAESLKVITKAIDESEALLKQSLNDKQLLPVSDKLHTWVMDLLSEDKISIPTFSQDLNYLLNGGLSKGRLYVLGAPPANGKSTISAQLGDLASSKGFKVIYASYEMSAEQIFITALSRLGKINSSLLENKKFLKDEKLKLKFFNTVKDYEQNIAENTHIIEADDLYTPSRLLAIIKKLKADLLIVDYLQLLSSGDQKLDNAYQETLRVSKIATELKRIARKSNIPIIAISDVNKNAYDAVNKGGDLDMSALRDSFKIAHSADVIMLLISTNVVKSIKDSEGNKSEKTVNQLFILAEKFRDLSVEIARKIETLAHEYQLEKATADTYSRLIIAKNRTGKCGEVLFRYSKALHYFDPMNYLTDNFNIEEF